MSEDRFGNTYPQVWITDEEPPRYLIAKGRSGIDPDCIVAELEGGDKKGLWIVDGGAPHQDRWFHICGLDKDAVRVRLARPAPQSSQVIAP